MSRINVIFPDEERSYIKKAKPSSHLQNYIDNYYEVYFEDPVEQMTWHTTLPSLNTSLCIRLKGPGWRFIGGNGREVILDSSMILGHSLDVRQSGHPEGMNNFFVSLKPGMVSLLLRTEPRELENTIIDPQDLFKEAFLEEQLCECSSFIERVALFEDFFIHLIDGFRISYKYDLVQAALTQFENGSDRKIHHLNQLCKDLAVSYPTLYRYFNDVLTYSPKFCQKLTMFRKGLEKYNNEGYNFNHWEHGFTDFSHFVKVSRQLTGKAPSEL